MSSMRDIAIFRQSAISDGLQFSQRRAEKSVLLIPGFLARQQRHLVRQSFRREETLQRREPMMIVGAMSDDSSTIGAALILGRSGTDHPPHRAHR